MLTWRLLCWPQVKAVEEEYSNQMRHLETQLEEALLQQQQAEAAAAEAEAAAAAAAAAVAASHRMAAHQLPAFDTSSAAEKTLQLLDKLLNVSWLQLVQPCMLAKHITCLLACICNAHHACDPYCVHLSAL